MGMASYAGALLAYPRNVARHQASSFSLTLNCGAPHRQVQVQADPMSLLTARRLTRRHAAFMPPPHWPGCWGTGTILRASM
eukprot:1342832-Prymnesium_polylepis.1